MKKLFFTLITLIGIFTLGACVKNYSLRLEFDLLEGSASGTGLYQSGANVTVEASPLSGYEFIAWYNADATDVVSTDNPFSFKMPDGDYTLLAVFGQIGQVETYQVLWKSQDGLSTLETDLSQVVYTHPSYDGATPTKPSDPQYEYLFAGWSTQANQTTGKPVNELPVILANAIYYAAFSAKLLPVDPIDPIDPADPLTYTVTWQINGQDIEVDQNVAFGTSPSYDSATPTKPSTSTVQYLFLGWSDNLASTTGLSVASLPSVSGNITYYAIFEEVALDIDLYTINWYIDSLLVYTAQQTADSRPIYLGQTPEKDGYTFLGWNSNPSATSGLTLENLPNITTGLSYYAIFAEISLPETKEIKISNTAKWESTSAYQIILYNELGWQATLDIEGASANVEQCLYFVIEFHQGATKFIGQNINYSTYLSGSEILGILYGAPLNEPNEASCVIKFNRIYQITWNIAGQDPEIYYVDEGALVAHANPTPVPVEGYTVSFSGWNPAVASAAVANATYTAQYSQTPNIYTITFHLDGGEFADSVPNPYQVAFDQDYELPQVIKDGENFTHWTYLSNLYPSSGIWSIPADVLLVAHWTTQPVLSFASHGGTATASLSAEPGTYLDQPDDPTYLGHEFLGWYEEAGYQNLVQWPYQMPSTSRSFHAKWLELARFTFDLSDFSYAVTKTIELHYWGSGLTEGIYDSNTYHYYILGTLVSGSLYQWFLPSSHLSLIEGYQLLFKEQQASLVDHFSASRSDALVNGQVLALAYGGFWNTTIWHLALVSELSQISYVTDPVDALASHRWTQGQLLTTPNYSKPGYIVTWYQDVDEQNLWDFGATLVDGALVTLYAHYEAVLTESVTIDSLAFIDWVAVISNLKFVLYGGSDGITYLGEISVVAGQTVLISECAYFELQFLEGSQQWISQHIIWSQDAITIYSFAWISDESTYKLGNPILTPRPTLTIDFDDNLAGLAEVVVPNEINQITYYTQLKNIAGYPWVLSRPGYQFLGWSLSASGSVITGNEYLQSSATFFALWQVNAVGDTKSITIDSNAFNRWGTITGLKYYSLNSSGDWMGSEYEAIITLGTVVLLSDSIYQFVIEFYEDSQRWAINPILFASYQDDQTIYYFQYVSTDTFIHALPSYHLPTVSFNLNGVEEESVPESMTNIPYNVAFSTLTLPTLANTDDFLFLGWTIVRDSTLLDLATYVGQDYLLYAKWQAVDHDAKSLTIHSQIFIDWAGISGLKVYGLNSEHQWISSTYEYALVPGGTIQISSFVTYFIFEFYQSSTLWQTPEFEFVSFTSGSTIYSITWDSDHTTYQLGTPSLTPRPTLTLSFSNNLIEHDEIEVPAQITGITYYTQISNVAGYSWTATRGGYTLAGWSLTAAGEAITGNEYLQTNQTLYALWQVNAQGDTKSLTVSSGAFAGWTGISGLKYYSENANGSWMGLDYEGLITLGTTINLPDSIFRFTIEFYESAQRWATAPILFETYADGQTIYYFTFISDESGYKRAGISYTLPTVSFSVNNEAVEQDAPEPISDVTYNATYLSLDLPSLDDDPDYLFLGWSFTPEGSLIDQSTGVGSDVTLYAQWSEIDHNSKSITIHAQAFTGWDGMHSYKIYSLDGDHLWLGAGYEYGFTLGTPVSISSDVTYFVIEFKQDSDIWNSQEIEFTSYTTGQVVYFFSWVSNGESNHKTGLAHFTQPQVSFDSTGGSSVAPISGLPLDIIVPPVNPTKPGYDFVGWKYEGDNPTITFGAITFGTANHVLYAVWTLHDHELTLDLNGGSGSSNPVSYNIENGSTPSIPTPSLTGYTFAGWVVSVSNGNLEVQDAWVFVKNTTYGDYTLQAQWDHIEYTLLYDTNGGSVIESRTYYIDDEAFEHGTPTKPGYTWSSWKVQSIQLAGNLDEQDAWIYAKGNYGNYTLIAIYTVNTYTLQYYPKGLEWGTPVVTVDFGESYTLTYPTVAGQTFTGYTLGEEAGGQAIATTGTWSYSGSLQVPLYANYSSFKVITFNSVGGSAVLPISIETGQAVTQPGDPTKDHYSFDGWYEEDNYLTLVVWAGLLMPADNATYFAKWSPLSYTVLFKSQDGTTELHSVSIVYNNKPTYSAGEPSKASSAQYSYTFANWASSINAESGTLLASLANVTADITYYAAFTPVVRLYSVNFDDNDESNVIAGLPSSITSQPYGTVIDILAGYDTWKVANYLDGYATGKYFLGWSIIKDGSLITGSEAIEGPTTLYAKWALLASITISNDLAGSMNFSNNLWIHYYCNGDEWSALSVNTPYYIPYAHTAGFAGFELRFNNPDGERFSTWIATSAVLGTNYVPLYEKWADVGGGVWKIFIYIAS